MADTNFNIKVGTQLNDTLQKQLDASPKKTITVKPILDTKGLQVGTKTVTQYSLICQRKSSQIGLYAAIIAA